MGCSDSSAQIDDEPTRIETDVQILLRSIEHNIRTDYEENFSDQNLANVLEVFKLTFKIRGKIQQLVKYKQLKDSLQNSQEKHILEWLQSKRANKYSSVSLPEGQIQLTYQNVQTCKTSDDLEMTRKTDGYSGLFQEKALLTPVKIGKSEYFVNQTEVTNRQGLIKKYLFRKKNNKEATATPWIVEQTKNLRYVWRGDIDLDKQNVSYLLKFLLTRREQNAPCPSILINAGSHGSNFGKNAHSTGNFTLTSIKIYDEMVDLIAELVGDKSLMIDSENVRHKIYIHKLDSSTPCIYSPFADHIIDVQCCGAFEKVAVSKLIPPGTKQTTERDLMFLERFTSLDSNKKKVNASKKQTERKKIPNNSKTLDKVPFETIAELVQSGVEFDDLQELNLSKYGLRDEQITILGENSTSFCQLSVLNLSQNMVSIEGWVNFFDIALYFMLLKEINLTGNKIGNEGAKALFQNSHFFASLRKIIFNDCGINDKGLKDIVLMTQTDFELEEVHFYKNNFTESGKQFARQIGTKYLVLYELFTNSKIISSEKDDANKIRKFLRKAVHAKYLKHAELLYRASENSFSAYKFHQKCDGIQNTLTVIETEYGKVIGGYTPFKWKGAEKMERVEDKYGESFLFSLTQNDKLEMKRSPKAANKNYKELGPSLGKDLEVRGNADRERSRCSFHYYEHKKYNNTDKKSIEMFSGSPNGQNGANEFRIKEYEVWGLEFNTEFKEKEEKKDEEKEEKEEKEESEENDDEEQDEGWQELEDLD